LPAGNFPLRKPSAAAFKIDVQIVVAAGIASVAFSYFTFRT